MPPAPTPSPSMASTSANGAASMCNAARFVTDVATPLRDRVALLPGSRDRANRPIIFFPTTETAANADDLRNLLQYFFAVTADDCKKNGFLFIIGTRKGTTRQSVKPILRAIHEYFPGSVASVLLIKPDNFLDKFKFSTSSGKYKFEVHEVSLENLTRSIDVAQLIREFGGSLHYDHEEWIDLRRDIERLVAKLSDCLRDCDNCHAALQYRNKASLNPGVPGGSNWPTMTSDEIENRLSIMSTIDFDSEINRLQAQIIRLEDDSGAGIRSAATIKTPNPDLAAVVPHLKHLASSIFKARQDLTRRYQERKLEQDHWQQFKMYETDIIQFKNWIESNATSVDALFTIIGADEAEATDLIRRHDSFVQSTENATVNYNNIISVGRALIERSSVGKNQVESLLKDLDNLWLRFSTRVSQRAKLLAQTLRFRTKTKNYFENLPQWQQVIIREPDDLDRTAPELETSVKLLEEVGKELDAAYCEAYNEALKLSQTMLIIFGDTQAGQIESYKHVIDVIQQLSRSKRKISEICKDKKDKLTLRMSYMAFMAESRSVIDWLEQHGEPYLRKKVDIGDTKERATVLTRTHENFKNVASNTFRNAAQLFQVAERLINAGEGDTNAVKKAYHELKTRIEGFSKRMELRSRILKLSAIFHLHNVEIKTWYDDLATRTELYEKIPESPSECTKNMEKLELESDGTDQAYNTVISEANQLITLLHEQAEFMEVNTAPMVQHVEALASSIQVLNSQECGRRPYQRTCLQVGSNIRHFLYEVVEIHRQLTQYRDELKTQLNSRSTHHLYEISGYHGQNVQQINDVKGDIANKFTEILQELKTHNLAALVDHANRRIDEVLVEKVHKLDALMNEVIKMAHEVTQKIRISQDLNQHIQRAQKLRKILESETDKYLHLLVTLPKDLEGVKILTRNIMERRTHDCTQEVQEVRDIFQHFANACAEDQRHNILTQYDALLGAVENYKLQKDYVEKLAFSAGHFYNSQDIIVPLIQTHLNEPIIKDYCLECAKKDTKLIDYLANVKTDIGKHKERFIKASMLSQKTVDDFLKRLRKCPITSEKHLAFIENINERKQFTFDQQVVITKQFKEKTMRIEKCQQAVLLRTLTEETLKWLTDDPDVRKLHQEHLCARELKRLSRDGLEQKQAWFNELKSVVKDKRRRVREMSRHIELYVRDAATGNGGEIHAAEVKSFEQQVVEAFNPFLKEFDAYGQLLLTALGDADETATTTSDETGPLDRLSDCTLDEKIGQSLDQKSDSQLRGLYRKLTHHHRPDHQGHHVHFADGPKRRHLPHGTWTTWYLKTSVSVCRLDHLASTSTIIDEVDDEEDVPPPVPTAPKPVSAPNTPLSSHRRRKSDPTAGLGVRIAAGVHNCCSYAHERPSSRHTWPLTKQSLRMPMMELIETEKKSIDVIKVGVELYLAEYRKAAKAGTLPPALVGKETAIFGNLEELYEFHRDSFFPDLIKYADNPTDVGCAFVNNIQRLREVHTLYSVNKQQHSNLHCQPDIVAYFDDVLIRHPDVKAAYEERNLQIKLDSVLMSPIQRILRYDLLLKSLIDNAPYDIAEIREVKETLLDINKYANDYMHLFEFDVNNEFAVGEFIMTDRFAVTEPKRVIKIKRDKKEYRVFLFENNLILAKREDGGNGQEAKYVFKERIMLSDVYVVEHVDSSNFKFGLRRRMSGSVTSTDNTIIFKADSEKTQLRWVKKLRELTVAIQHNANGTAAAILQKKSLSNLDTPASSLPGSNRNSRTSRDSCELSHTSATDDGQASLSSSASNNNMKGDVGFRLSQWPPDSDNA